MERKFENFPLKIILSLLIIIHNFLIFTILSWSSLRWKRQCQMIKVNCSPQNWISVYFVWIVITGTSNSAEINVHKLTMELLAGNQTFNEVLLSGEITDVKVQHIILSGTSSYTDSLFDEYKTIFLFIKGRGILNAGEHMYTIESESIALPTSFSSITITVSEGDTLHYVRIRKRLSSQDLEDIKKFSTEDQHGIYFTNFRDCIAYTEKIKSPKTVSRTILPKDHVPRVAMGTVETIGPDEVGAHEHPMLDQLFLGLTDNNVIVHANGKEVRFQEFVLLHIPLGSRHWVEAYDNMRMYYIWMDFFLDKKGEEWLDTHKPVDGQSEK